MKKAIQREDGKFVAQHYDSQDNAVEGMTSNDSYDTKEECEAAESIIDSAPEAVADAPAADAPAADAPAADAPAADAPAADAPAADAPAADAPGTDAGTGEANVAAPVAAA